MVRFVDRSRGEIGRLEFGGVWLCSGTIKGAKDTGQTYGKIAVLTRDGVTVTYPSVVYVALEQVYGAAHLDWLEAIQLFWSLFS